LSNAIETDASTDNLFQTEAKTYLDRPSGASRSRQKLVRGALSTASNRSERQREGNRLRREAREALDKISEAEDRRLEIAQKRETKEREREREREKAREIEERAAGRQRSKDRFEVKAALEEGLAALEEEDDGENDNDNDADAVTGGNAITPAEGTARSFSHLQLHRIPSHISAEENPLTVNAPMTATNLNVQPSVVESRGSNAVQSNKNHHIPSTVCQISENQNIGTRTNQCQKSGREQTPTSTDS
jgi:hypothetical protein